MKYSFSRGEKAHLSLVENSLTAICLMNNLELNDSNPLEVRGVRSWQKEAQLQYKGKQATIFFEVSYGRMRGAHYFVPIASNENAEIREGIGLWEVRALNTYDLDEALRGFNERIEMLMKGKIPESFLPREDVWIKREHFGLPKEFAKEVPIFEVTAEYNWRKKRKRISVRREFCSCEESTKIDYNEKIDDLIYEESVLIKGGGIVSNEQKLSRPDPLFFDKLLGLVPDVLDTLPIPEIEVKGFPEIKKLEHLFLELPWQEDFKAIYQSAGAIPR